MVFRSADCIMKGYYPAVFEALGFVIVTPGASFGEPALFRTLVDLRQPGPFFYNPVSLLPEIPSAPGWLFVLYQHLLESVIEWVLFEHVYEFLSF